MDMAHYAIQSFSFVPDTTGYVTIVYKVDGSLTQCAWHNVPPKLDKLLEREAPKGVRQVAVGMNGSYVVILNTGVVWWNGVPEPLSQLLKDAEKSGRRIVVCITAFAGRDWEGFYLLTCCVFRRLSLSRSSQRAGISSNSPMALRNTYSLQIGMTLSTVTPRWLGAIAGSRLPPATAHHMAPALVPLLLHRARTLRHRPRSPTRRHPCPLAHRLPPMSPTSPTFTVWRHSHKRQ